MNHNLRRFFSLLIFAALFCILVITRSAVADPVPFYTINGANDGDGTGQGIACVANTGGNAGFIVGSSLAATPFVDLYTRSGTTITRVLGPDGSNYGIAIAPLGDVSNPRDGVIDFVVGAPRAAFTPSPQFHMLSGADGSPIRLITTFAFGDTFGSAVAGLFDDQNANGEPDVIIGAPLAGGGLNGSVQLWDRLSSTSPHRSLTGDTGNELGGSLTSIAPLNEADTLRDIVAGAPGRNSNQGAIIWIGSSSGNLQPLVVYDGDSIERFGSVVANLGNIFTASNADEILASAPDDNDVIGGIGGAESGSVKLLSLGNDNSVTELCIFRGNAGDRLGTTLASLGDVDNDGSDEFAIGSPSANGGLGAVYIYSFMGLANCPLRYTIIGTNPNEGVGVGLCGAQQPGTVFDVNGDTIRDFALSAAANVGQRGYARTFIVPTPTPTPTATSTITATPSPTPTAAATATPSAPSVRLSYKILPTGVVDGRITIENQAPSASCSLTLFGRRTRADRSARGPVRTLLTRTAPKARENFRATRMNAALRAENNFPFSFHLLAELNCGGRITQSNVFARHVDCGLQPKISISRWETRLANRIQYE